MTIAPIKKMRVRIIKVIAILVIVLNVLVLYYMWGALRNFRNDSTDLPNGNMKSGKSVPLPIVGDNLFHTLIEEKVTVVIRKFEHFENDVTGTVESFLSLLPNIQIVIVSDFLPYPPINLRTSNYSIGRVKMINLQLRLTSSNSERNPLLHVHTRYILFVPDSTRITSVRTLHSMLIELQKQPQNIVSAALSSTKFVDCFKINTSIREWFIQYSTIDGDVCDAVKGKQVLLVDTKTIKKLPEAFMLPFPDAFYIQTAVQNIKVKLIHDTDFTDGKLLFQTNHAQLKLQQLEQERQQRMFQQFGLKKVVRETGVTEWYGCNRDTPRCFGTVVGDMPQYLWEGKWTPPCCLAGLRRTARHVFARLDEAGVRYWLEGGSLLGAMRGADILPWDYDVDVGIYRDDIVHCSWLARARIQPVTDHEGFVWEKASEGDFFRVQFSRLNHLHVDLFPFYQRNGTMTKDTWFPTHKQDREFPEYFLHPMSSIEFVGRHVPAPNNIRDFLELKFGKGSIENPEYPDPSKMKFSPKEKIHSSKAGTEN
ncbi:ribitol 5-phosphate transferase FKRP [Anabrus simplex]|uniref:ribitol 5-phosphate transferase FKRP n=1 Tax=Anabrus simplex TaxID=316456 RepID=UPI0034DD4D33